MIAIRTLGWSALVLAAFAGCGKEPEPAAPPASDTTPAASSPAMAPATTPAADAATPAPASDMPTITAPQPTPATKEEAKPEEKKPDDKAAAVSLSADEVAEINKLPEAESALALKQLVCPVSDEHLGSMGTPLKVTAEGQTFYICCKGCNKDVKDDPAAVVAKLKK